MIPDQVIDEVEVQKNFFQKFLGELQSDFLRLSVKVLFAIIVLAIGVIIIRIIRKAIRRGLEKADEKVGLQSINFIDQTIKFVLYTILFVIIAQLFGVSAASVVALLGSAGLTIGLAFQGALSNFAGGVLLLIHKPFSVGDYITLADNNTEGEVIDIGIIYTTLRYNARKVEVVPNGKLANCTITNLTGDGTRLLQFVIAISYSADIKKAKSVIESIVKADEDVINDENLIVYVDELAESSVNIGIRTLVPQTKYITTKWRLQENIKIALDDEGIVIPFNQLDVHVIK